jgi:molybdenum storage protein
MGKLIKEDTDKGRLHIDSPLMGESLVSKQLLKRTEAEEYFHMHPDINVVKIGGQSIMDRGGKALLPILEALIKAKDKHKILLMTGGGTRARHVYNIGVDLGMPTGVLSKLGERFPGRTQRCFPFYWQNMEVLKSDMEIIWNS